MILFFSAVAVDGITNEFRTVGHFLEFLASLIPPEEFMHNWDLQFNGQPVNLTDVFPVINTP